MKASKTILPHLAEGANFVASPGRRACPKGQGPQDAGGLPSPHTPRHCTTVPTMTSTLTDNDPARIINLGSTLHDAARWSHACGHQVVPSLWLATRDNKTRCPQKSIRGANWSRMDHCGSAVRNDPAPAVPSSPLLCEAMPRLPRGVPLWVVARG